MGGIRQKTMPQAYHIGHKAALLPVDPTEFSKRDMELDPRGIVWMWEAPRRGGNYVMGIDPTGGITGWDRHLRTENDVKVDNAAIEILRITGEETPDIQVCEYAAPIDSEDLADIANVLGRIYGGNNEDGQCLCIIEVYPGPGLITQRRLINNHGYTNLFVWKFLDSMSSKPTNSLGWTSSPKSVQSLWIRGKRRIQRGLFLPSSPWLVEEMGDAEMDMIRMRGKAIYGKHDDRVCAALMAMWAGHDWSYQVESEVTRAEGGEKPASWQASDMSAEAMQTAWEERWAELSE